MLLIFSDWKEEIIKSFLCQWTIIYKNVMVVFLKWMLDLKMLITAKMYMLYDDL